MYKNQEKKILIYCRESRDDGRHNYNRIETQRDLLLKYCKDRGYSNIVKVILDDNKSGTDFLRFNDIKELINKKIINCIIFKNSSRLGRNQKESLEFVEYLERNNIEIIFEDEKYNEELFGLYAWFNERRARDDSKNIKRNLKHKMEVGEFLISSIYGYEKEDKKLVPNSETSKIVKQIYRLFIDGNGYKSIAKILNHEGVSTPSQIKNNMNTCKSLYWKPQMIKRILEDERYTGKYIAGIYEKVSFKSKKVVKKDSMDWLTIENYHSPIITNEDFKKVKQLILKNKVIKEYETKNKLEGFSDVYCGKCGSRLYKRGGSSKNKRPEAYICRKYLNYGKYSDENLEGCNSHRLRVDKINEFVTDFFCNYIKKDSFNSDLKKQVKKEFLNVIDIERKKVSSEVYKFQLEKVYQDYLEEKIPEFLFERKKEELTKCILIEEKKIKKILNLDVDMIIDEYLLDFRKKDFNLNFFVDMLDKIVVYNKGEIDFKEKKSYSLCNEDFNCIEKNGGVIFLLKNM